MDEVSQWCMFSLVAFFADSNIQYVGTSALYSCVTVEQLDPKHFEILNHNLPFFLENLILRVR